MSTDILKSYEQQFGVICADITSKISKINDNDNSITSQSTKDILQLQNSIDTLFQEARELIEQMELEIRDLNLKSNFNSDQKQKYSNIIKSYKNELNKLELEFKRRLVENKSKRERHELFLTEENDETSDDRLKSENDIEYLRKQKQTNNEKLVKMNKTLENGYQIALESEEIGKTILGDLNNQREVIQRSRDRLRNANEDLGTSSRVLSVMTRRLMQNKFLLFALFMFLLLFSIFVVYLVIKRKKS